jgi:hypothetical protein
MTMLMGEDALAFSTNTKRPKIDQRTGLITNSQLTQAEWAVLDAAVIQRAKLRLNIIAALRSAGLVQDTTLANMLSQWRVASERTAPTISMDGRTRTNRDRTDKQTFGVPVPIIHDAYSIGRRELLASRTLGAALDTTEAAAAASAVVEGAETMVFNGASGIVVSGSTIYGLTNHPARTTDTAANFGGGDFGTISLVQPTFLGAISAMAGYRYHGPFNVYVSGTQYIQMLARYSDGSGQKALDAVLDLPQIADVQPSDFLSAGQIVMVQMTSDVIDLVQAGTVENREWVAPDGEELFFKVMMVLAPRLKQDYAGKLGVCHITGA